MIAVGVDACKKGWIAVVLRDGEAPTAHHLLAIDALPPLVPDAEAVTIDIPIGLPVDGRRAADEAAWKLLGPRRHSVFSTPVRAAIEAATYADASLAGRRITGSGISQQAYALAPRILEIEQWLPSAPWPVYEVHPEVSFRYLLGAPAKAPKKTWAGMVERRRALAAVGISLDDVEGVAPTRASVDDMLDAAVAAWTAGRILRREALTLPESPPVDPSGRLVAIWA